MPPSPPRLLLDSPLLLLAAVGLVSPERIRPFKRTSNFTSTDFDLLMEYMGRATDVVTTPHVLAEVSNLAGQATGEFRDAIFRVLQQLITEVLHEERPTGASVAADAVFRRLGVTDTAILTAAGEGQVEVLTVDANLWAELLRRAVPSQHFEQLRFAG